MKQQLDYKLEPGRRLKTFVLSFIKRVYAPLGKNDVNQNTELKT